MQETWPSPEPAAFVLTRDRHLNDLVRFCAISDGFLVLTVDPTFNLGDFDVTPTTYRHCLLISTRSGKNPVMIGPIMIHTYVFFAATLVGLRRELVGLRAFGTDGEKALADVFSHKFHYAVHLTCFIHCRWNIKSQLQLLGYPDCASKVLDDIFGRQHGNTVMKVMIVHVLLCNLFYINYSCCMRNSPIYSLHALLCTALISLSNNPLESTSTRSQNITFLV